LEGVVAGTVGGHVCHYSEGNLTRLVERCGFKVQNSWTADRWAASFYNWGFNRVMGRIRRVLGLSPEKLIVVDWLPGAGASYLANPVHFLLGTGSELVLLARKVSPDGFNAKAVS
jgi:hypothetical protein